MNYRSKSITFGDKIFARVTRNGKTIYNFMSEKVSNMAQLISELRFAIKDVHGLVMIHIRNYNQGWGDERPLMLYAPRTSQSTFPSIQTDKPEKQNISQRMLFPWETH